MPDTTGLVALIVAAVALVIAATQLTQQVMATGYVIRKCDRIVTGGLTKGGSRQWHWRQFRFTVRYQTVIFALPRSFYSSIGISPTVQVTSPSPEVFKRASETRGTRETGQACWVTLVQDLTRYACLDKDNVCLREESGDRVPDDLTVAPTRVDGITVLLSCIAMGMQVFKYSPTTGEITMSGGAGSLSSSEHPVLGGLLHYSVFSDEPEQGLDATKLHSRALRQEEGVWANGVYGRFRDRSLHPDFVPLELLRDRKVAVLEAAGWPSDSQIDTIGGAATFMAFANVDVYLTPPPSVSKRWCANFAEVIVKWHQGTSIQAGLDEAHSDKLPSEFRATMESDDLLTRRGCSSPRLPRASTQIDELFHSLSSDQFPNTLAFEILLMTPSLIHFLKSPLIYVTYLVDPEIGLDPSSYTPKSVGWDIIQRADFMMSTLSYTSMQSDRVRAVAERAVARSISVLAEVGAPSWFKQPFISVVQDWEASFSSAVNEGIKESDFEVDPLDSSQRARVYAYCSIIRAAYYTIMMRANHDVGPGLYEDSQFETALLYMA